MATQTTLTSQGLKDLEERLEHLKSVTRKEIAEKIKVALSFGDLSENSEYDEAKNEQGIVEAEIAEIEATLKNAKVVDEDELSTEHVNIGNTVVIEDESGKKIKFFFGKLNLLCVVVFHYFLFPLSLLVYFYYLVLLYSCGSFNRYFLTEFPANARLADR